MDNKILPLGSVVLLKGGQKRVMIIGFGIIPESEPNKMFDYCGCIYPEGIISTSQNILFNSTDIEKIFCIGYKDEECAAFLEKVSEVITKRVNQ